MRVIVEDGEPVAHRCGTLAIARGEGRHRFGMREVESAAAGDQELAPHRTARLEQVHRLAGGEGGFGGHQAGRTATHHRQCDAVDYLPFLAALSARFSFSVLVGFFFSDFFWSIPLDMGDSGAGGGIADDDGKPAPRASGRLGARFF